MRTLFFTVVVLCTVVSAPLKAAGAAHAYGTASAASTGGAGATSEVDVATKFQRMVNACTVQQGPTAGRSSAPVGSTGLSSTSALGGTSGYYR